jgi:integrase
MASLHAHTAADGTARWLVRWREGGRDSRQRSRSFHRKADARNFQADIIRRGQLGELYEDDGGTLGAFLDAWLGRYALRVRPSSQARRVAALRVLPDSLRSRPLAAVTAADVEDAVTEVAARAPRQAELALASLKLALKDAAKRGLRFDRRILELASPRSRARKPTFLDWEQVCEVASWMPNDAYNRLVRVAALTGLRRGEILALTWADIDLERRTLAVREGKTDAATRSVDLSLRAARLLRVHKGRALGETATLRPTVLETRSVSTPGLAVSPSAPVFPNNQGGHHDGHNFYSRIFKPAARAANQPSLTFHGLRHSYISMMAAAGAHPSVIAAQVGHKDGGALILRRYRHLFPHEGREAADRLDDYLGRKT